MHNLTSVIQDIEARHDGITADYYARLGTAPDDEWFRDVYFEEGRNALDCDTLGVLEEFGDAPLAPAPTLGDEPPF